MRWFTSLPLVLVLVAVTQAAVISVPLDQPTIQAGIDAAGVGDTVLVSHGTYYEHPQIDLSITLLGGDPNYAVVHGSDSGSVLTITANGVKVRRLSFVHGGSYDEYEAPWDAGIHLIDSDSCALEYCIIRDNGAAGIAWTSASYNQVSHCAIIGNKAGIYAYEELEGPYLDNAYNEVHHNYICDNSGAGIHLEHAVTSYHLANDIRENLISGNNYGMTMIMSQANEIRANNFNDNANYAILLSMCMGGGQNNEIYYNCFLNNNGGGTQGYQFTDGLGANYWYAPMLQEGNYWSDYTGSDGNGDGIGDHPYPIAGGETEDSYPLMQMADTDDDGIIFTLDNCVNISNPEQEDQDYDFVGDSCDNCLTVFNPDQTDANDNGVGDACEIICGDADGNAIVNVSDGVYLINYIFGGGPAPVPLTKGDVDCNEIVNVSDVVYLIAYVFAGGPEPCADCPR